MQVAKIKSIEKRNNIVELMRQSVDSMNSKIHPSIKCEQLMFTDGLVYTAQCNYCESGCKNGCYSGKCWGGCSSGCAQGTQ